MKNNVTNIKVHRTIEGNIFEAVTAMSLVAMWILTVINRQGDTEPMMRGVVFTAVSLFLLVAAYYPSRLISMPFKLKTCRQYVHAMRLARTLAVELSLLGIVYVLIAGLNVADIYYDCATGFILMITDIVYTLLAYFDR